VSTVLWLTRTQLVASGIGGILYRLVESNAGCGSKDEVHFHDPTQRKLKRVLTPCGIVE
jgi:hypothetical protein